MARHGLNKEGLELDLNDEMKKKQDEIDKEQESSNNDSDSSEDSMIGSFSDLASQTAKASEGGYDSCGSLPKNKSISNVGPSSSSFKNQPKIRQQLTAKRPSSGNLVKKENFAPEFKKSEVKKQHQTDDDDDSYDSEGDDEVVGDLNLATSSPIMNKAKAPPKLGPRPLQKLGTVGLGAKLQSQRRASAGGFMFQIPQAPA